MVKKGFILILAGVLAGCMQSPTLDGKLGGSEESFIEAYGPNEQADDAQGLEALFDYASESGIVSMFIEDHAVFVLISLTTEAGEGLALEEALEYTAEFFPEDAELIEEEEALDSRLYTYESRQLNEAVGTEEREAQTFTVTLNPEENGNYALAHIQTDQIDGE